MGLSTAQMGAVQRVVQTAPDTLLTRLKAALSAACVNDPVFTPVFDIARDEVDDRRARDMVLEPLKPLADASLRFPKQALLGPGDPTRLWRLIRKLAPDEADAAAQAALTMRPGDPIPPEFDELCILAADALEGPEPISAAAVWSTAHRSRLAKLLRITPVLREALHKLPAWIRNPNGDHMAAVRLAFKDASVLVEDAGPLFMEAMMINVEEPSQVLRLISAVMDRPSDRYLASSELAGLAERLLDDIDRRVQAVRDFDPNRGSEGGAAEAASLLIAGNAVKAFEEWLAMSKDSLWGARLAAQKQGMVLAAEARLKEAEPAVSAALPVQRQGGRGARPAPRIDIPPDEALVRKAEGLLAFLDESRSSAQAFGFGSTRAKVIEALEKRLDPYVEELVELVRSKDCAEPEKGRAYLNVAANLLGMIRGPQAAQIVRRRAAA